MAKKLSEWQKLVKKHGVAKAKKLYKKPKRKTTTRKRRTTKKGDTTLKGKKAYSKAKKKSSTGKKLTGWNLFVKKHKGSGKSLKQLSAMYKRGASASSKKKPTKSSGRAKRLTASNCEAVKTHTVSKGYRMTARKRKAGKRRTTKY
jgi:hypothetical protein